MGILDVINRRTGKGGRGGGNDGPAFEGVEPSSNADYAQSLVSTGFGRGGGGSFLWQPDEDMNAGEYDRWFDAVMGMVSDRLDAPSDMLLKAQFSHGDDLRLASLLMELGDFELHAACNNSSRMMHAFNLEFELTIQGIATYRETGKVFDPGNEVQISDPIWHVYNSLIIVDDDESLEAAERQAEFLRRRIHQLRADVNRAKAGGWFVDYSHLSDYLMQQNDPTRKLNAAKLAQFPYHYRVLHSLCVQSPGGILMHHEEGLMAKQVVGMGLNNEIVMRNHYGPRSSRQAGSDSVADARQGSTYSGGGFTRNQGG